MERLLIGIHPDRRGDESYSEKWAEFLAARGTGVPALDVVAPAELRQAAVAT
jgi:hypothetical protein